MIGSEGRRALISVDRYADGLSVGLHLHDGAEGWSGMSAHVYTYCIVSIYCIVNDIVPTQPIWCTVRMQHIAETHAAC